MSKVQRLISFFSREGSPQEQESSLEPTVTDSSRFFDIKREAPNLISVEELGKQIRGENFQSFRTNPTYAHYFRGEEFEGLQPRPQVGGFSLEPTERPTSSFEFQRPIQPKASPASIESPQELQNLPDNILDVFKTPSEASRLGNTVEGTFKRGGLTIPSQAPRPPPAKAGTAQELQEAQPALPAPQATEESTPIATPVTRNIEPQSAPTQTPQIEQPIQPIASTPDYENNDGLSKATRAVDDTSLVSQVAPRVSKVADEGENVVKDVGKTVSTTSGFLAGSEGFVNPILDGIGLIGGIAGLIMGSGLFAKKPTPPPAVAIPKPAPIVIPSISQTLGGGQV